MDAAAEVVAAAVSDNDSDRLDEIDFVSVSESGSDSVSEMDVNVVVAVIDSEVSDNGSDSDRLLTWKFFCICNSPIIRTNRKWG